MKQIVVDHMNTVNSLTIQSPISDRGSFRNSYTAVLASCPETQISTPRVSKDFKLKKGLIQGRRPKPINLSTNF